MAFVARLAIAAVIFAFALNVVITLQNLDTTKTLRLLGQELDGLRLEMRVEREARVLKERSATYLVFKKEAYALGLDL